MWNLYRGKERINVELKNGHKIEVVAQDAYFISLAVKEGLNVNRIPYYLKNGVSYIRLHLLTLMIKNGLSENKAVENIKQDKFIYKGLPITIHLPPNNLGDPINEIFWRGDYSSLDVQDKIVIDIGGFVGDSAIYFALKGATKVIMLEPSPKLFEYALRNIKENNLEEKIIPLNAAYGGKEETLIDENLAIGGLLKQDENGVKIRQYTLEELVKNYYIDRAVLKMDCEGCEYALLDEPDNVFNKIDELQIEYHYGYKTLLSKLELVGFGVNFTKPKKIYVKNADNPFLQLGYVYAKRRS